MTHPRFAPALLAPVIAVTPVTLASGAPGAPGIDEQYLPASKAGLLTSRTTVSTVWATIQAQGGLGEIFYPTIGGPSARSVEFVVAGHGRAVRANAAADVRTSGNRQVFTARDGRWTLTADYVTDPARSTVLVSLDLRGAGFDLFAIYDPALGNSRSGDSGSTAGDALVATDGDVSSALVADPPVRASANGFAGVSDGRTDLLADGRMDWHYSSAPPGNLVQTALLRPRATLALGFAGDSRGAISAATTSLRRGFGPISRDYAYGWKQYLAGLRQPPASLRSEAARRLYRTSAMVLAASEDKQNPGAYVAAPAAPWAFGRDDPSGPYHLVWSRDLYQIATGLLAAGDRAGAARALDFLFRRQQKPDGSFPQNSQVDGTPVWGGLQLDEVALPIVLAYQLGRTDPATWDHVRRAADFLVGFRQDGFAAPWSPQERWENQSGYSPGTIAATIAGLVCAASLARANGDPAAAGRYLATADDWRSKVKSWTVTSTGPYSARPYFLRLTKDGNPDAGTTYDIGDSGPAGVDQRRVVDPSFLELVRLGVLPAHDRDIRNSLSVVDRQLGVSTPNGFFWHRASFDGFGEKADGSQWEYDLPDGSLITRGRAWPLLNGERGEYQIAAGARSAARDQLATMVRATGPGGMLPEQVWDNDPPAVAPGRPTYSATPLTWSHAQFLRLAWNVQAGRVLEQPAAVAGRYLR
ncbi:glycoside hydrolase family 15 protein [Paractinoplanes rishiriensis]|uniref:Glucan 1,4-alpha-glucosidase n=1 Tax=Paractinoplanes rishiriensis TaxID=1050105 RepID=A0A919JWF4_9ACTN|nr:glycoside hydrolase family 15 protein [Actinoplanes rishiriensis]GIE94557.1 glucan 1,4-alpha-glucosidase [Actinoplanes rishiriensis]